MIDLLVKRAAVPIALVALGLLLSGCKQPDVVVLTGKAKSGEVATIVASTDSRLFATYRADLVIQSPSGRIVCLTNLLRSRDNVEEIRNEFLSLEFKGNTVQLGSRRAWYDGPHKFIVPR